MMDALIKSVLLNGGPMAIGLIAGFGCGLALWRSERKANQLLTDKVLELATAQVESNTENKALLQSMRDVLTQVLNRM